MLQLVVADYLLVRYYLHLKHLKAVTNFEVGNQAIGFVTYPGFWCNRSHLQDKIIKLNISLRSAALYWLYLQ